MTGGKFDAWAAQYTQRLLSKLSNGERADVLHSLVSDSDVLNYNSFESWASELGYDLDSRKAEGIYRACLSFSLALRNGLGEQLLADLREAVQDY